MSKKIREVIIVLTCVVMLVGAVAALPKTTVLNGTEKTEVKKIKVTGTASVDAIPDIAYINVGVVVEDKDLEKAQENASKKMNEVKKTLKELDIDEKDIKTINFSINPKTTWIEERQVTDIVGYKVNNLVEVQIKNIDKIGKIIDKVVESGSNTVSNLRLGIEDETELYNKALGLAMRNAEGKALALGKEYKINKVTPLKIEESGNSSYGSVNRGMVTLDEPRASTPISLGEMKITANVIVEFGY